MSSNTGAAPPATPKVTYFNAHINPQKPPLLPPKVSERIIAPLVTAVITALILSSIKPPFIQKRNNKNKPSGDLQWPSIILWSLAMGVSVFVLPLLVRAVQKTGN
jgi:hypothetical protein